MHRHLRLALLGRLGGVDLKIVGTMNYDSLPMTVTGHHQSSCCKKNSVLQRSPSQ